MQGLGVKQPRGFAKGAQRRRPNPQSSLNGLQGRSLLQSAQAGNRGTKEVEQQEADVLVVEQLAVAGPITLGTDVFESRQQGHQRVEILQAFNVTRLQSSSTWSGHRCLHAIPEILRVRMKASRKYHANPLAQNSCRTVLDAHGRGERNTGETMVSAREELETGREERRGVGASHSIAEAGGPSRGAPWREGDAMS